MRVKRGGRYFGIERPIEMYSIGLLIEVQKLDIDKNIRIRA